MKRFFLLLTITLCFYKIHAQVNISSTSYQYTQNFNTLNTQSNQGYQMNVLHWKIAEFGSSTMGGNNYRGGNGSDPTEDIYSFGSIGSNDRALGSIAAPGLQAHYGVAFRNTTGAPITTFYLGFRQEQWRVGDTNPLPDTIRCYYSLMAVGVSDTNAANWVEVPSLMMVSNITDSTISGSTLNGNLYTDNKFAVIGVNIADGDSIIIKWVDRDNPGLDDGLAIDDVFAHIGNCAPSVTANAQNVSCYGGTDGSIQLSNPTIGTPPFMYSLDGGPFQLSASFTNVSSGVHTVTIQEGSVNQCTSTMNVPVQQPDSIAVNFGVTESSCSGNEGTAWANVTSNVGPYSYSWNTMPVQTNDTAIDLPIGQVVVTITDGNNCSRMDTLTITHPPIYNGEEICSVTVDSATNKNLVVWNKLATPGTVEKYYIYRADSVDNNYTVIDSVAYSAFSTYLDNSSDPANNYYSYYITAKTACEESTPSPAHSEMRLRSAVAQNGNIVFEWSGYQGISGIDSQYLYYSVNGAPFEILHTIPFGLNADAHVSPPYPAHIRYFVAVPKSGGCSPFAKTTAYELVMSNIVSNYPLGIEQVADENGLLVYPNPSNGLFNIAFKGRIGEKVQIEVTDVLGKTIKSLTFTNKNNVEVVDLQNLAPGAYMLRIVADNKTWNTKVVIR